MANMLTMKPANIDPQAHMVAVSIFHIQSLLIDAEWQLVGRPKMSKVFYIVGHMDRTSETSSFCQCKDI